MAITYGFFNSLNGDRVYNADDMSEYFKGLVSDGVYESVGNALMVYAVASTMYFTVATGRAIIDCKWIENDSPVLMTLNPSHVTLNRYTGVFVQLDLSNRVIDIVMRDGEPATNPTKPEPTNTSTVKELCLAYIYVGAGVTGITQANVTDNRGTSLCPWVTGLVDQVDTSVLFLQYQTACQEFYDNMTEGFEEWFETLTDELNVNTYIKRYTMVRTLVNGASFLLFDASGYTYDADDIIDVYINGLKALITTDYTVEQYTNLGVTTWKITFVNNDSNQMTGATVEIDVTKSKIGYPV